MRFLLSLLHILHNLLNRPLPFPPAMADPPLPPPPPPPPPPRSNFPMLCYGLIVVATAAVILVLYNLVIVKWCNHLSDQGPPPPLPQRTRRSRRPVPAWRAESSTPNSVPTFKYEGDGKVGDSECAVCLSVFEEGEEIRQMPKCKHYFHAPCIDMWLYSHMDCPLCRSPVDPPLLRPPEESERPQEGLLPGAAVFLV